MFLFGFFYDCEVGQQFSLKMGTFRMSLSFPHTKPIWAGYISTWTKGSDEEKGREPRRGRVDIAHICLNRG